MEKAEIIKEFLRERASNGGKQRAKNYSKAELSAMAKRAWKRLKAARLQRLNGKRA